MDNPRNSLLEAHKARWHQYVERHFIQLRRLTEPERRHLLRAVDSFHGRSSWMQKLLLFYSTIRHLLDPAFMTIARKRDAYFLLKYRELLENLHSSPDEPASIKSSLSQALKSFFNVVNPGAIYYTQAGIHVRGYFKTLLLSELLERYKVCRRPSSSKHTPVRWLHYAINKLKQAYYHFRFPMKASLMLEKHYGLLEPIMAKTEIELDQPFCQDLLIGYATACAALLPAHAYYSHCFFTEVSNTLGFQPYPPAGEHPAPRGASRAGWQQEQEPLLERRSAPEAIHSATSDAVQDNRALSRSIPKGPPQSIEIATIKTQFDHELHTLHDIVLALGNGALKPSSAERERKRDILQTVKKMLRRYHPDKHGNEPEALCKLYTQLTGRLTAYYALLSDYLKTGERAQLTRLHALYMGHTGGPRWPSMGEETISWEALRKRLDDLLNAFSDIRKEHVIIAEQHKKIAEQHKEIAEQHKEIAEQHKEIAEQHKEITEQQNEIAEGFIEIRQQHTNIDAIHKEIDALHEQAIAEMDLRAGQRQPPGSPVHNLHQREASVHTHATSSNFFPVVESHKKKEAPVQEANPSMFR